MDMLRGYGIFLVFLGHASLTNATVEKYIFSFHMPLFFFVSGIFCKEGDISGSFRAFLKKKLMTRMVPYVSFGTLTYCIWVFSQSLKRQGVLQSSQAFSDSLYKPLLGMLYGNGINDWLPHNTLLWFLACLFITEIIFFVVVSIAKTRSAVVIALVLFSLLGYADSVYSPVRLPFSVDVALTAVVFYGLGYLLKDYLLV